MKTRATPGSGGRARSKLLNASRPPADAPMATTGNVAGAVSDITALKLRSFLLRPFLFGALGMNLLNYESPLGEIGSILAREIGSILAREIGSILAREIGSILAREIGSILAREIGSIL